MTYFVPQAQGHKHVWCNIILYFPNLPDHYILYLAVLHVCLLFPFFLHFHTLLHNQGFIIMWWWSEPKYFKLFNTPTLGLWAEMSVRGRSKTSPSLQLYEPSPLLHLPVTNQGKILVSIINLDLRSCVQASSFYNIIVMKHFTFLWLSNGSLLRLNLRGLSSLNVLNSKQCHSQTSVQWWNVTFTLVLYSTFKVLVLPFYAASSLYSSASQRQIL